MKNIAKITAENAAPLFGEKDRPSTLITGEDLKGLKGEGVNFETYTMRVGDTLTFPAFDEMIVRSQPVRKDSETKVFYVACERTRNGKKQNSWFNVNSLAKRDADNNPVYPEWYELGNVEARLQKLAEIGAITAKEEITVMVPTFDGNKRVYNDQLKEDGTTIQVAASHEQPHVAVIIPVE